jgi:hypothetical protein
MTYDKYGVYLTVSNLCVGSSSTTFGKAMIYSFDKDAIHGYRALKVAGARPRRARRAKIRRGRGPRGAPCRRPTFGRSRPARTQAALQRTGGVPPPSRGPTAPVLSSPLARAPPVQGAARGLLTPFRRPPLCRCPCPCPPPLNPRPSNTGT